MTVERRAAHDDMWRIHGACSGHLELRLLGLTAVVDLDPDLWFPEQGSGAVARRICGACPVRVDCLTYAIDNHEEFGVWGGAGEHARRFLARIRDRQGDHAFDIEVDDHFLRLDEFALTGSQPQGAAQVNGPGARHGKASTYGRGCRCDLCRAAKMDSLRRTSERQRAAASDPVDGVVAE